MATGRVNVGGVTGINIFTQLTEPKIKDGIWIQTDKSYRNVLCDSEIIQGGKIINSSIFAELPMGIGNFGVVYLDGFIYTFGGSNTSTGTSTTSNCYKYDLKNNSWSQIASLPFTNTANTHATEYNGRIFVGISGPEPKKIYEYHVTSNTFTLLGTIPYDFDSSKPEMVAAEDGIHVMGGYNSNASSNKALTYHYVLKYDGTWTQLANLPAGGSIGYTFIYGGDIYIYSINGNNIFYKYKIADNTYTQTGSTGITAHKMTILNNKVYYLDLDAAYTKKNLYEYDISKNLSTLLGSLEYYAYTAGLVSTNDKVLIIGGRQQATGYTYSTKVQGYAVISKKYPEKTVVIHRSNENTGVYLTEFITPFNKILGSKYTRFKSGFNNAWLFINDDLQEYPSYYGNGTQWIKFKN